ncbi:MAG: carbamoyltransferase N-terminal domain-containing protein [Bacteroidota bacterium]|nr:carbamoyltransferase N-terminal domain-containing protein [Bacteroidota bacterium]
MITLGISAYFHDSSAAICKDGIIIAAVQEERLSRIKNDASFPIQAIKCCLKKCNIKISDIDAIVFYDKPMLKFERILETYYHVAPKGFLSFLKSIPIWFDQKLFIKQNIYKSLLEIEYFDKKNTPILFTEHHLSHAASSFFTSPFEKSAILTVDGVGEWATASLGIGDGNQISFLKELHFPDSVGLLYSSFTYFLGFKVNSGEYKMMGLAPFGDPEMAETIHFENLIRTEILNIHENGSIKLNQSYFKYLTSLKMIHIKRWEKLFQLKLRNADSDINQSHCNLAFAIQKITEEIVLKMAQHLAEITQCENICLAGGVALNCVSNGKLQKAQIFKSIYIQAAAGDAGGAIGAALAGYHIFFNKPRKTLPFFNPYLGPSFSQNNLIENLNDSNLSSIEVYDNKTLICKKTAQFIQEGKVVAWFQGEMEFGPRALGNRSIIANPSFPNMQNIINLKIKKREAFRPFAPAVLEEDAANYFNMHFSSPYMLMVSDIKETLRINIKKEKEISIIDKLNTPRSEFQSITHVDFSARVQTVSQENNPLFYELLNHVKLQTGHGMLINTSMNVRGEPMVCSPEEAYQFFKKTKVDVLVIENYIFIKHEKSA